MEGGMEPIGSHLLSPLNGLNFRELRLVWNWEEDVSVMIALVERYSSTLEALEITCELQGATVEHL